MHVLEPPVLACGQIFEKVLEEVHVLSILRTGGQYLHRDVDVQVPGVPRNETAHGPGQDARRLFEQFVVEFEVFVFLGDPGVEGDEPQPVPNRLVDRGHSRKVVA